MIIELICWLKPVRVYVIAVGYTTATFTETFTTTCADKSTARAVSLSIMKLDYECE